MCLPSASSVQTSLGSAFKLAGIEDVVVNAVGLSFILQIDELLCLEHLGESRPPLVTSSSGSSAATRGLHRPLLPGSARASLEAYALVGAGS